MVLKILCFMLRYITLRLVYKMVNCCRKVHLEPDLDRNRLPSVVAIQLKPGHIIIEYSSGPIMSC